MLFHVKVVASSVLLFLNSLSCFAAFISFKGCSKYFRISSGFNYFSLSNCFSIGLFVGIALLGLFSSSSAKIKCIQLDLAVGSRLKSYPLSESLLCFGLFLLFTLDWSLQMLVTCCSRPKRKHASRNRSSLPVLALKDSFEEDGVRLLAASVKEIHDSTRRKKIRLSEEKNVVKRGYVTTFLLWYGLSFHTFLEAMGLGMIDTYNQVVNMAIIMSMHQVVCSSTLGLRLARVTDTRMKCVVSTMFIVSYLFLIPSGVLVGAQIHHHTIGMPANNSLLHLNSSSSDHHPGPQFSPSSLKSQIIMAFLQNLAASSFIYIVMNELIQREVPYEQSIIQPNGHCISNDGKRTVTESILCFCFTLLGYIFVCGIRFFHHG